MPLVRYEVRNEYGLANPELYRAAALDDPKGLLEGVTVAGLVGIVRQLGDLAELATGVFHELHEEVMATAARGHDLLVRVQQLEAELPVVEKYLFMDANQLQFASASGAEWHARIRTDQNHLTQGDLPRFIRTLYEECRGPPKLFLLDKFDGVGDGACLKRYTDPSFFKMEWASSELMKAEKEQRDKQAQRIKKGRRRRSGEINGAFNVTQMFSRVRYSSLDVENMIGKSGTYINKLKLEPQTRRPSNTFSPNKHVMDNDLQASPSKATLEYEDNIQPNMDRQNGDIGASVVAEPLKVSAQGTETEDWSAKYVEEDNIAGLKESSVNLAHKAVAGTVAEDDSDIEQFVDALTTMDSEVETDPESKAKRDEDSDFFSKVMEEISKHNEVPDEQRFDADKDLVSILPTAESNEPIKKTDPVLFPTSPVKTESSSFLDEDDDLPSLDEDDASSILNKKSPLILEHNIETLGLDHVSKSSPIPELKSPDDTQLDDSLSSFYLLPDPVIQLANADGDGYLNGLGSLSSHRQTKSFEMPTEGNTRFTEEKPSFDEPESVPSRTPEEFSPGSSAESISIQPMWFTMAHTSIHDTSEDNEDIDYMQVSSSSSSFSSSTISSPRPSLLATTEFHVVSKAEPKLPLSSQISASSSPIFSAPHSPVSLVKIAPLTSTSSEPQMQSLHSELLVPSSPMLSSEFTIAELEDLPPPPPLPPLEWRMMKSQHRPLESALKPTKPSPPPPAPPIPPVRFENGSQDQFPSVVLQKFQRRGSLIEAIAIHDKSMLRKVKEQRFSPIRKPVGEREVLLEQIRTRSFSLRHTVVEKHETPRAVTNINVAAILEKANAIRQALAGSDEDEDDWSNS